MAAYFRQNTPCPWTKSEFYKLPSYHYLNKTLSVGLRDSGIIVHEDIERGCGTRYNPVVLRVVYITGS